MKVAASIVSFIGLAIVFACGGTNAQAASAPPSCQAVSPSNNNLWPPNGKFENITIAGLAADQSVVITAVKQDEDPGAGPKRGRARPINNLLKRIFKRNNKGSATNATSTEEAAGPVGAPDAAIDGGVAMIRHERLGGGDGRVYHIYFNATNSTTNEVICTGEVTVCVPKSQGGGGNKGNNGKGKDKDDATAAAGSNATSCVDSSLNGGTLYDSVAAGTTSARMLRA
jgi:hypothetical protein